MFLAWIKTSAAVINLGLVVARFGLWFSELAARISSQLEKVRKRLFDTDGLGDDRFGGY